MSLVFALVSFVSVSGNVVFMSKVANQRIVAYGLEALVPMPDRLAWFINDLGFLSISCKTRPDPVLAYVAFFIVQEAYWSCSDLEDPFFPYRWRTGELSGLAEKYKRVPERNQKADLLLVNHEHRLACIAVRFQIDVRLSGLDDAVMTLQTRFGHEHMDASAGGVVVLVPAAAGDDKKNGTSENGFGVCLPRAISFICLSPSSNASSAVQGCWTLKRARMYCASQIVECLTA